MFISKLYFFSSRLLPERLRDEAKNPEAYVEKGIVNDDESEVGRREYEIKNQKRKQTESLGLINISY